MLPAGDGGIILFADWPVEQTLDPGGHIEERLLRSMSTPYANSVQTSSISTQDLGRFGALISGYKWGEGWGHGVTLTYSFPSVTAAHAVPYGDGEYTTVAELSTAEKAAVVAGLGSWSAYAGISFVGVAESGGTVGDIRFAGTNDGSNEAAHTYYPSDLPEGGDVWFHQPDWHLPHKDAISPGSYEYLTIIHELGHALGLKHPFEDGQKLPAKYDSYSYTVMSYSAHDGSFDNYANFYPTTPMYYDIEAVQKLYGRKVHNADNTTYAFHQGEHYWQTIDDSGGIDTIAYSGSNSVTVDLRIRHWSELGRPIDTNTGKIHETVAIGPNTTIENGQGGAGNDTINGNSVPNLLSGGGGRDRIEGFGAPDRLLGQDGADWLFGGTGNDLLNGGNGKDRLDGEKGRDTFLFDTALSGKANVDTITGFSHGKDTIELAAGIFTGLPTGALGVDGFRAGSTARDSSDRIVYDHSSGTLYYDPDGNGAAAPVGFAKLAERPHLSHIDLFVV